MGVGTGPEQKQTPPRFFFLLLRPRRKAGEGEAPLDAATFRHVFFRSGPTGWRGKEKGQGVFCCCAFVSCLVLSVSRILLAVVPGRAELSCCCAPLGAASFSAGPEQKKNTTQSISIVAAAFVGLHHLSAPWQPVCHWSLVRFCCSFRASRSVLFVAAGLAPILSSRKKSNRTTTFF